ncbi:MAG: radical SAM protein [Polyangiaceae bacterium]|nr:radical SAM protein [Polyangiaceae bacterium]
MLNYEGPVYRPPSEADSLIVQATIGCSWNHCTYCAMYRHKAYREREIGEVLHELQPIVAAVQAEKLAPVRRIFVADGDALAMPMANWRALLQGLNDRFPRLNRISCYATARNLLGKSVDELNELRQLGLSLLYIGPESGDDVTLKRIAKGATFAEHAEAASRAHAAGIKQSLIFLLGAAGLERSLEHARGAGKLTTAMDPRYVSLLTVTVVPNTPLATLQKKGRFQVPPVQGLIEEIRAFLLEAKPTKAIFRSNHASNYLPLSGQIPRDTSQLLATLDAALHDEIPLRPEWMRGL